MRLTVLAFSTVRERLGAARLELELPPGATCADVVAGLARAHPEAGLDTWLDSGHLRIAHNRRHVPASTALHDGDEVALFPPTAGG